MKGQFLPPGSQTDEREREEAVLVGDYTDDFACGSLPTKSPMLSP